MKPPSSSKKNRLESCIAFLAVGVPVLLFGLLIAIGPHSIQKVMDKRDFDGKIHTHSTNSTKLTRLSPHETEEKDSREMRALLSCVAVHESSSSI